MHLLRTLSISELRTFRGGESTRGVLSSMDLFRFMRQGWKDLADAPGSTAVQQQRRGGNTQPNPGLITKLLLFMDHETEQTE